EIMTMVLSEGAGLVALGVGLGILAGFALGRVLSSQLFGVSETDPVTYIAVSLLLGAVALAACYVPARRAARFDPIVALRYEEESMMETLWQDIRYGVRMLRKDAGFTAIALLTLALGIGANTAIFSILDAVLLKPLPFPEPHRLMAIWGTDSKNGEARRAISYPDFTDYHDRNRSLEALAAYTDGMFTLTG